MGQGLHPCPVQSWHLSEVYFVYICRPWQQVNTQDRVEQLERFEHCLRCHPIVFFSSAMGKNFQSVSKNGLR